MRALVRAGATGSDAVAVMAQRLARLGVADVVVLAAGDCASQLTALAEGLAGRTLIVDADLIVADACLGQLVDDPAVRSGALVGDAAQAGTAQADADGGAGEAPPVRVAQKRIASAGSAVHDVSAPTAASLGALVIDARDVPAATEALIGVAAAAGALGWHADPIDLALVGLVRAQIAMGAVTSVGPVLRGGNPEQRASVEAELAGIDEARVLLERANRPDDGFYSTFVLRRASTPLTALALRMRLTPNQISVFSLFVGLAAALCFATGTWWRTARRRPADAGLAASSTVSTVRSRASPARSPTSARGSTRPRDRVKEYAAYAGLAAGSPREPGTTSGCWPHS